MKKIVILTLTLFLAHYIKASHIAGGDLSYTCLGNNQYEISLNLFVDCDGTTVPGNQEFINFESSCGDSENISVNLINPGGTEISQLCDGEIDNSSCNGGTLPGMWLYKYTGVVTLSPCNSWTMSWNTCCRNGSILNIQNAVNEGSYIETTLNSATAPCNNSPSFTSQPIPYVCANQIVNYSYGVVESDGDSLHYSLIGAMESDFFLGTVNLSYSNGYSASSPLPGITIDPNTGALSFTPTTIGHFVVVVQVEEYDENGDLIGTVMRDIQFVVQSCSNLVPDATSGAITNLSGTAVQTGPFSIEMCEGANFSFSQTYTDPNLTDTLSVVSNIATVLPGAALVTSGTNPLTATVSWTSPAGSANTNTSFTMTLSDGACPVVGQQTFVYDVNVQPRTLAGPDKIICGNQTAQLNATGGSSFTWTVVSGPAMVVGTNFSCDTCANVFASPMSTTSYEVVSNLSGGGCLNKDTVTVTVVPDFSFTTTQSTDTLCLQQTVQLGVTPSPAGSYEYLWSPASYLDFDTVANPIASVIVPGTYDYQVNITSPTGCLKKDTVTITVLPEIRTYAFADTILCLSQSAQLSANGGSSFVWSSISGSPVTVGTNFSCSPCANAVATPGVTTVYQVTSNLGGTCINKDTVTVTVVPDFTTTTTQSEIITCLSQPPIQLGVIPSPAGTYTYDWNLESFLDDDSIANPVATITTAGVHNFIARVTSSTGCVKLDTAIVTITPSYKPDPIASAADPIVCVGDTAQLNVTFNVTIPASCGLANSGCAGTQTAVSGTGTATNSTIGYPAPYGNWYNSAKHQFLFLASELTAMGITGGKIDQLDFNVTQINGLTTYHEFTINMGCTNVSFLGNSWVQGLYNVYTPKNFTLSTGWNGHVFDNAFEWDGISNVIVEICFSEIAQGTLYTSNSSSPYTPTSFISCSCEPYDPFPVCPSITPGPNFFNSNNRPNVRFHYCGAAPDSSVYSYSWFPPVAVSNPTVQSPTAIQNSAGTTQYYVVVTDTVSGCLDTAYVSVTATSPTIINVSAGNDTTICPGAPTILSVTGATDYAWTPGTDLSSTTVANPTASPTSTITYTVTGISECITGPAIDSVTLTVLTAPPLSINAGSDQEICGTPYNLMATSTGGFGSNSFAWTVSSGSILDTIHNPNSQNASVIPTEESMNIYQVMVTDFCGDTASDYVGVNVIMDCKLEIPNVFTPNGDGKNDVFLVGGVGMQTYSATIYDRWGKKVFESTDIQQSWDGKGAQDGTYYYIITAQSINGKEFDEKGYLLLLGQ